ncbi:MAG: hypothetical protein RL689_1808 [Planctomycetota bacterium]|jgi:hypothetical protein
MNRASAALTLAFTAAGAVAQPVQWRVQDGGNGHWYEERPYPQPPAGDYSIWTVNAHATALGGHLATVSSASEAMFVANRVSCLADCGSLIGGYQLAGAPEPGGGWAWVTGEPMVYLAWRPGKPTNLCLSGLGCQDVLGVRNPRSLFPGPGFDDGWTQCCGGMMIVEWSADCNNDGLVDKGQILSGELADANNNGIPDGLDIAVQPTDQSVGVDVPVTFIVEVAATSCPTPVTYQWQRRNPAVSDPNAVNAWLDLADGAGFFGTKAPNLSISRPIPALATGYRCKIGGGCGCEPNPGGFVYTDTVNFSVACPADFNADGGIDFGDIESFFARWENGC